MAAIAALRTALGALRRNPVLFLAALVYGVVVLPQSALSLAGLPIVPALLQILTFFVTPFVLAGLLGMADEAIDGDASLGTLRAVGTDRYAPFLVGKFVEFAINAAFAVVLFVVGIALVLTIGVGPLAGGSISTGTLAFAAVVVLAVVVVAVVVRFLIQFFPVFIVVADADAVDAFTDSYRFVRDNLAATLGYTLIQIAIGVLVTAPLVGFTVYRTFRNFDPTSVGAGGPTGAAGASGGLGGLAATPSLFSTPEVVALSLLSVAVTMLGLAIQQTYAVSFYRRHANADATVGGGADGTFDPTDDEDDAGDANEGVSRTDDDSEWRYE